jgi:hypothetical protein
MENSQKGERKQICGMGSRKSFSGESDISVFLF